MKAGRPPAALDATPLVNAVDGTDIGSRHTGTRDRLFRNYQRAKQAGRVSHAVADEIIVTHLHKHPIEIYGDAWLGAQ